LKKIKDILCKLHVSYIVLMVIMALLIYISLIFCLQRWKIN